ncbi:MAG TPA: hypothetical protein VGM56_02275 [Byssovorax sp.]|jgi:hypothetical protein
MRPHHLASVAVLLSAVATGAACGSSDAANAGAGASAPDASSTRSTASAGTGTPATTSGAGGSDATSSTGSPASGGGTPSSAGGGGAGTFGDPTGRAAIAAVDFLGSIGVCTHVGQGVDAPDASATAIAFAGIRALRDDGRPEHVQDWVSMHASSGVRVALLTNQDVAGTVAMAKSLAAAGALLAVEGPNEPNNFPVTYGGATSDYATTFVPVANLQRDLYAAVKAEPSLAGIPVFHASEAGGSEPDDVGLQFLTIPAGANIAMPDGTQYADYANTHNYVCGHSSQLVDNVAWSASDPTLNGDWDGPYVEYGHTWHGGFDGYADPDLETLPKVTTETGWVTQGANAISEEQQARLFLNLYLAAYARGFSYTFVYMLRDDPVQGYWGLFDVSYQPKQSGTYLHNLTTILDDAGGSATGLFDYSIASEPATVHDLLLQKGDGTFELVVWDERPSGGSDDVIVDLGHPRATVRVYDPTTGTTPTNTQHGVESVTVTLTDHPVVLEI